jgi:hypothetical protein
VEPSDRLLRELEEIGLGAKSSKDVECDEPEMACQIAMALWMTQAAFCEHVGWPDLNRLWNAMRRQGMRWEVLQPA